jgi:hypothetical protein
VLHRIVRAETGKENECDHSEGVVHFIPEKKFIQVQSRFGEDHYIEKAKGNRAAQIRYCSKNGEIWCQTVIEQKGNAKKTARRHRLLEQNIGGCKNSGYANIHEHTLEGMDHKTPSD